MNILNIEHIRKVFGEKEIFKDVSLGIQEGDKIGIVGINGTGKTTLLKIIAGAEAGDEGQVVRQKGLKMAWLPQNPEFFEEDTVMSYVMRDTAAEDWAIETNLTRLGIRDFDKPMSELSGGQRRKAALAKVLSGDFDMLLLDEPTNHLDESMILWLEEYLKDFKGTLIMVTHDRYFLDKISNRIIEISQGQLYSYRSNYSGFLELKAEREEMALAAERKRKSVLRMELDWARRGCRARTTKQRARLERLEALKNGKGPIQEQQVEMESIETRMGKKTIELHQVSKSYGGQKLIDNFDYIVLKNQRLGIVGANGCGKSTLIKILAGKEMPDSGYVEVGETVKIGYMAQEEQNMDGEQRVLDYIKDIAEYVQTKEGRISASKMLERFLFTPDMQYTPLSKLSGGEKRRLCLLSVLVSGANVLILDEPSNNVDIPTLTILEDYLNSFSGIVITVSHDRYFLDNVVDRIFEFSGDGQLIQYEGGYTDYLEAKEKKQSAVNQNAPIRDKTSQRASVKAWKQHRPEKLKFSYKEEREYMSIDDDISALEEKLKSLDDDMMANATNSLKLSELTAAKTEVEQLLDEKMERWVYLNDLAERIEAQKE